MTQVKDFTACDFIIEELPGEVEAAVEARQTRDRDHKGAVPGVPRLCPIL